MSSAPSFKENKYDRQLRLWGAHGQAALESSHICLINATATGCEILKNLVLPAIGSFTVLDAKIVDGADIGCNFFLDRESLGQSRAKRACELLQELNPDVQGEFVQEDAASIIRNNPEFFDKFNVIIACDLVEAPLLSLAERCWDRGTILCVARSYGFIGYVRNVVQDHAVLESKPEYPFEDLRILEPFPALAHMAAEVDLEPLDGHEHSHVPYPLILIHLVTKWKADHMDALPKGRAEQDAFKAQLAALQRNHHEENFNEAKKKVSRAWAPTTVPGDVKRIFASERCTKLTEDSPDFWVLARAVKDFTEHEGGGLLPVMGSLPDMTSTTARYVALQEIYKNKANEDLAAVKRRVEQLLAATGKPAHSIPDEVIQRFCKNAAFTKLVPFSSLKAEYSPETAKKDLLGGAIGEADSNVVFYVLLRAVDRFYAAHTRWPGVEDVEGDVPLLKAFVDELLSEWGITSSTVKDEYIHEMCRFGKSELHGTAALVGGVASQEIIKLITHQFTPMNNTYIYNGINSTGNIYCL